MSGAPNMSALELKALVTPTDRDEDVGVGGLVPWLLDGGAALVTNPAEVLRAASEWWQMHSGSSCEDEPSPPPEVTSDLWKSKEIKINEHMHSWDQLTKPVDIVNFMKAASETEYDTLAHVIMMKKSFSSDDGYPERCKSGSLNFCYHGHLLVVFEPIFRVEGKKQRVVSMGFYPDNDSFFNLIPLPFDSQKTSGTVTSPDDMFHSALRSVQWERIKVLQTFTITNKRMKGWHELTHTVYDTLAPDREQNVPRRLAIDTGKFGFYSGLGIKDVVEGSMSAAVSTLSTFADLSNIINITEAAMNSSSFNSAASATERPVNCARWVQLAFPEADILCPFGIPRACVPRHAPLLPAFKDIGSVLNIAAATFAESLVERVADETERALLNRALKISSRDTLQPPQLGSRPDPRPLVQHNTRG